MVFTAAQTTAFFEQDAQMGLPNATVVELQNEGITTVNDLVDFDKDTIKQVSENLRRPAGRIPDPDPGAAPGATIPTPPFVFGAKSQKRLIVAADAVRYYETVGRPLTAANMAWNPVLRNFAEQWKALVDRKDEEEPDVPKISNGLPIIKWTEAFTDYLHRVIGVRMIPLAYVIRDEENVPAVVPPLAPGAPHSVEHGSVEAELIARSSHANALYREDNAEVYYKLEEATRATSYAASIKPFQRAKNGRGAWLALTGQYAGPDKWESEIKRQEQLLHTRIWKGQSNFTLERFIAQHRNAFVSMTACAEHIQYQLPNEFSRVGFLLDAIQCNDAGLQAAMASIKTDTGPEGMRNDFEASAAHLLQYDPVAKKRAAVGAKRGSAEISDVSEQVEVAGFGTKPGIGKTGVHFRYYKKTEYQQLSSEQKEELREWRKNQNESKKNKTQQTADKDKDRQVTFKKAVAAAVEKQLDAKMKSIRDEKSTDDEFKAYIASIVKETVVPASRPSTASSASVTTVSAPSLKSILKRAKNGDTS